MEIAGGSATGRLNEHDAARRSYGQEVPESKGVFGNEAMRYPLLDDANSPPISLKLLP